jgi:hypothetical protein
MLMALVALAFAFLVFRLDSVQKEYKAHLIADQAAVESAAKLQAFRDLVAKKAWEEKQLEHDQVKARLALNNDVLIKKLGDLYALKTNTDFRLASYRDRMLLAPGDSPSGSDAASDTERLTACRRELDSADSRLSTVEEACAMTTAEFNLARGWIDIVCNLYECKDRK